MKKCDWCGSELKDNENVCPKCQALCYGENNKNPILERINSGNKETANYSTNINKNNNDNNVENICILI